MSQYGKVAVLKWRDAELHVVPLINGPAFYPIQDHHYVDSFLVVTKINDAECAIMEDAVKAITESIQTYEDWRDLVSALPEFVRFKEPEDGKDNLEAR